MSYTNPYREQLKEDDARYHYEAHVLPQGRLHIEHRREAAVKRYKLADKTDLSSADVERARRRLEEEMFQEWYEEMKARGLAQFGDPFAVAEDYE